MCQGISNFSVSKYLIRFYIVDLLGPLFLSSIIIIGVIALLRLKKTSRLSTREYLIKKSLQAICIISIFSLTIELTFDVDIDVYAIIVMVLFIIYICLRAIKK